MPGDSNDKRNKPSSAGSSSESANDEARRKLAQNWASMTASMVAPDNSPGGPLPGGAGSGGSAPRPNAPSPAAGAKVTPLPLPGGAAAARAGTLPTPPVLQQPAPPAQPMQPVQPAPLAFTQPAPAPQQPQAPAGPTPQEELDRDRGNLGAAIAFTIVAVIVGLVMAYIDDTRSQYVTPAGPSPFVPMAVAIGVAWAISIAHRVLGRNWLWFYLVPVAFLLLGPTVYGHVWNTGQEDLARSYLSPAGRHAQVDVTTYELTSQTVNTPNGCFAVVRDRRNGGTTVTAASATPQTARQHADTALAPRFAASVEAGGATAPTHIFSFKRGTGPPTVAGTTRPMIDCAVAP